MNLLKAILFQKDAVLIYGSHKEGSFGVEIKEEKLIRTPEYFLGWAILEIGKEKFFVTILSEGTILSIRPLREEVLTVDIEELEERLKEFNSEFYMDFEKNQEIIRKMYKSAIRKLKNARKKYFGK